MAENIQATGKRKTAIARVYLAPGEGRIVVNRTRDLKEYFPREAHQRAVLTPLTITERVGWWIKSVWPFTPSAE